MTAYILRKLLQSILLIGVVLIINFFILRLTPGNPYDTTLYLDLEKNNGNALTAKQQNDLTQLKNRLSIYFEPAPEAFTKWAGGVLRFDFGYSVISGEPFTPRLMQAALNSFWLLLFATLIGSTLGISLGLYAAYHPNSWQDTAIKFFALIVIALPGWYMLIAFDWFNTQLWLLTGKNFSIVPKADTYEQYKKFDPNLLLFWRNFKPIFFLGAILLALFWGQTRSQTLAVLNQDYVRTARAKGLRGGRVLLWHVLRNSLNPIISIFGGLLPFVFASQILIESRTSWDGLGQMFLGAASARDYTILMAIFTLLVLVCVFCSFLADIALALIDPKIREKYQGGINLRIAQEKQVAEKNPRKAKLKPVLALTVALVMIAVAIGLIGINLFVEKAVAPVPTTVAQKTTFDEIALPADAKILISDIKSGERKAFLPPVVVDGPTPQPAQDVQKESKRVIFSTNSSAIDLLKKYQAELASQCWAESKSFPNKANSTKADYVFEKGNKFIWLSVTTFRQLFGNNNNIEPSLIDKVQPSDTVVAIVQGFKSAG